MMSPLLFQCLETVCKPPFCMFCAMGRVVRITKELTLFPFHKVKIDALLRCRLGRPRTVQIQETILEELSCTRKSTDVHLGHVYVLTSILSSLVPMGNELKWLLKEGGGCIFESCDISLENMPTSHTV